MKDKEVMQRLRAWTASAEAGDVGAMEALGAYYDAVRPETMMSRERLGRWLGAAAQAGSAQAAMRLAQAIADGRSTPGMAGMAGSPMAVYEALVDQAMRGGVPMAAYLVARKATTFEARMALMEEPARQGCPEALRYFALALFDSGEVERAEPWLRRFLAMEEAAAQTGKSPYTPLGKRFWRMTRDESEMEFLPDAGTVWRLGVCRERAGDVEEAVRLFRRVIAGEGLYGDGYVPTRPVKGMSGWERPLRSIHASTYFNGNDFKSESKAHLVWMAEQGLIEPPDFTEEQLDEQGKGELEQLRHPKPVVEEDDAAYIARCRARMRRRRGR